MDKAYLSLNGTNMQPNNYNYYNYLYTDTVSPCQLGKVNLAKIMSTRLKALKKACKWTLS